QNRRLPCATKTSGLSPTLMSDNFVPYRVVLSSGPLSPAEDINTAPFAKLRRSGNTSSRIERGEKIILRGDELSEAMVTRPWCDARLPAVRQRDTPARSLEGYGVYPRPRNLPVPLHARRAPSFLDLLVLRVCDRSLFVPTVRRRVEQSPRFGHDLDDIGE